MILLGWRGEGTGEGSAGAKGARGAPRRWGVGVQEQRAVVRNTVASLESEATA